MWRYTKIAILGTGAYGLSLALTLKEQNHEVTTWTKFEEEKKEIEINHEHKKVLPNIRIPEDLNITTNLEEAIINKDLIIIAIPAGFVDTTTQELKKYITKDQHICIASKGIEQDTCLFVTDVVEKHISTDKISVISGPSFAIDIVQKMPIGLTLASKNKKTVEIVQEAFKHTNIKLRITEDVYGTEICGSIKNVIAIAAGILDGLGAPESTKAMFVTESLHDIKDLIKKLDGDGKTILSFAGFGDLLLTCTSPKSRNFTYGKILATKSKEEIKEYQDNHTIEGLYTLKSIYKLINNKQVSIPIIDLIYDIILNDKDPSSLLTFLLEKK